MPTTPQFILNAGANTGERRLTNVASVLRPYGFSVALIAIAHVLSSICWPKFGPATHTIFLATVVLTSMACGYGPSLLATGLAGIDLAYAFIPPYDSFRIGRDEWVFVLSFVAVAVLISTLQARRRAAETSLRRERENLERRVGERTVELVQSQDRLARLVSDVVTVAEREQQRIGRDLHDGLGQELTGISLLSSALADRLRAGTAGGADDADQVAELVQQSIQHTRDLARGLSPVDLEDEGLVSALGRLAERVSRLPRIRCAFRAGSDPAINADTSIHLYRIAQEAINNAIRHGGATYVSLHLEAVSGGWRLTIVDNGTGFVTTDPAAGMGRRLMQHRADTIGATLNVQSEGTGVRVVCSGGSLE